MALAERELKQNKVLTYEDYLTEGETPGRYEIIDGVREYMTNPASEHQIILGNIFRIFQAFGDDSETGIALRSPVDIVVDKDSLRVRQPDLLYISFERWGDRDFSNPAPLKNAPELVIEILSPTETKRHIETKIREYAGVGVLECWLVSPEASTIEVLQLSVQEVKTLEVYSSGDTASSFSFPGLSLAVEQVFKMPRKRS